jgi:hypothetical protein
MYYPELDSIYRKNDSKIIKLRARPKKPKSIEAILSNHLLLDLTSQVPTTATVKYFETVSLTCKTSGRT